MPLFVLRPSRLRYDTTVHNYAMTPTMTWRLSEATSCNPLARSTTDYCMPLWRLQRTISLRYTLHGWQRMYGKKQKAAVPFTCGVVLMLYPYFVTNTIMLVVVGVALAAIPYFVKIWISNPHLLPVKIYQNLSLFTAIKQTLIITMSFIGFYQNA